MFILLFSAYNLFGKLNAFLLLIGTIQFILS